MLTDGQIKKFIDNGKIRIDPFDEQSVKTSVYRVRLGDVLLIPVPGQTIDLMDKQPTINYDKVIIGEEGYVLKPKCFVLGQTAEAVALDGDVSAFIDGTSTLARLGISVHQSSTIIQPGQDEHIITLELFNAGEFSVVLRPGASIGKLIFFQSTEKNLVNMRDQGKYVGQKETTAAKVQGE